MEKKLKFYGNSGKFDNAVFIETANEPLIIKLQVETGRTVDYYATIENEKGCKVDFKVKDKTFEIPHDLIIFGSIDITITAKVKNETINTYFCESLLVKSVGGEKQVIPEIQALYQALDKSNKKYDALEISVQEKLDKFEKCIEALMEG